MFSREHCGQALVRHPDEGVGARSQSDRGPAEIETEEIAGAVYPRAKHAKADDLSQPVNNPLPAHAGPSSTRSANLSRRSISRSASKPPSSRALRGLKLRVVRGFAVALIYGCRRSSSPNWRTASSSCSSDISRKSKSRRLCGRGSTVRTLRASRSRRALFIHARQ